MVLPREDSLRGANVRQQCRARRDVLTRFEERLQNNRAEDGDYPGTVEALLAAGAPAQHSPPIGDEAIDVLLAKYAATT